MQTHTITTYSFSELSPEAQERAVKNRCQEPGIAEHEPIEAWQTAEAFNALYPARAIRGLDPRCWTTEPANLDFDPEEMEGLRAWKWLLRWVHDSFDGVNQYPTLPDVPRLSVGMDWKKAVKVLEGCPLTGVFYDCSALDPIRKALSGNPKRCGSIDQIFRECGDALAQALEDAIEWHSSEEANKGFLADTDGDVEFLEDGSVYI